MDQLTAQTTLAQLLDELTDPTLLTSLAEVLDAVGLDDLAADTRADAAWVAECEDHDHELEALIATDAPAEAYDTLADRYEGLGHRAFAELVRSEADGQRP
jgi:hypothetical protein